MLEKIDDNFFYVLQLNFRSQPKVKALVLNGLFPYLDTYEIFIIIG